MEAIVFASYPPPSTFCRPPGPVETKGKEAEKGFRKVEKGNRTQNLAGGQENGGRLASEHIAIYLRTSTNNEAH